MMDEKEQAREDVRNQEYMQDKLREFYEANKDKGVEDTPPLSAQFEYDEILPESVPDDGNYWDKHYALRENERLCNVLAAIREEFFHYGEGYDHHMDGMVTRPEAILDAVSKVLGRLSQNNINEILKKAESEMFSI